MSFVKIIDMEKTSVKMAKRLKKLREEKGLSHEKLSKAIDEEYNKSISKNSLINYEVSATYHQNFRSNIRMSAETLLYLADFYEVSADYLLGRVDIKTPETDVRAICEYTGLSESAVENLHIEACGMMGNQPISALIEGKCFEDYHLMNYYLGLALASKRLADNAGSKITSPNHAILEHRGLSGMESLRDMAAYDYFRLEKLLDSMIRISEKEIPEWILKYYGIKHTTVEGEDNGEHQTD